MVSPVLARAQPPPTSRTRCGPTTLNANPYGAKKRSWKTYQRQITQAQETGNGTLANTISKASSYLDQLYSQRDVNGENLKTLQDILGVQSGITNECKKQAEFGGGKIVKDADGNDLTVSQTWDSKNSDDRTLLNQLMANMKAVMGSGLDGGYGMSLWKQYLAESNRLAELANQKAIEAQIAANKKIVDAMTTAAGDLSSSATDLSKSGLSLAESLRSAARKITDTQISLATSGTSTLSPEQQYALARHPAAQAVVMV